VQNPHQKNLPFFWKTVGHGFKNLASALLPLAISVMMSAAQVLISPRVAGVRTNVQSLLQYSLEEKKRNFLETVELQASSASLCL